MDLLGALLIVLGCLVLVVGTIWFVVNAFRVSALWGIMVSIFTPAWIRFAFRHWDMARRPLLFIVIGLGVALGGDQLLPAEKRMVMKEVTDAFSGGKRKHEPKASVQEAPVVSTQDALEIELQALAAKENDLRARKAAINPKDAKAVNALKEEIARYNAELQPVMLQMKERGMQAATR